MIYLQLVWTFFKIGLFSFGGGYAMIPIIQQEVTNYNWLTMEQFIDIIAVAESTPGPIAINTATFVGFKLAGVFGAMVATLAVCLPAFILVVIIMKVMSKYSSDEFLDRILSGIKPIIVSLIFLAAFTIGQTVMVSSGGFLGFDWISITLAVISFIATWKYKAHPILLIILAGLIGILIY